MPKNKTSPLHAILYALLGFSLWVTGDTFMKLAGEVITRKYQIIAVAGASGMAAIFLFCALRGGIEKLRPKHYKGLIALAIMFGVNYVFFLTALVHLPLPNFYTILFLSPTLVAFLAALLLREPLGWQKIVAIIMGFAGVVIAVNPTHLLDDQSGWIGYGCALAGMFIIVAQQLTMRFIGQHESRESTAFYPRIAGVLGGTIAIFACGFEPMPIDGLIFAILTGCSGGMGWMCMAHAYKLAPASTIAPFHYSQIIIASIFSYLIWHHMPDLQVLCGAAIIIASGIYMITHTRKSARLLKEESHV